MWDSKFNIFPYGTQFFRFHIHFHRKEVHDPKNKSTPPLREILDPPLEEIIM